MGSEHDRGGGVRRILHRKATIAALVVTFVVAVGVLVWAFVQIATSRGDGALYLAMAASFVAWLSGTVLVAAGLLWWYDRSRARTERRASSGRRGAADLTP
jgi:hypothetical protein